MRRYKSRRKSFSYSSSAKGKQSCEVLAAKYILRLALETGVDWEELFRDTSSYSSRNSWSYFLELPVIITNDRDTEEEINLCKKENLEYLVDPLRKDVESALMDKLEEFQSVHIDKADSPIFENVEYLGNKLNFTKLDQEVLIFHILMGSIYELKEYAEKIGHSSTMGRYEYCKLLESRGKTNVADAQIANMITFNVPNTITIHNVQSWKAARETMANEIVSAGPNPPPQTPTNLSILEGAQ